LEQTSYMALEKSKIEIYEHQDLLEGINFFLLNVVIDRYGNQYRLIPN